MELNTLSKLKIDDAKEFEIYDPSTGKSYENPAFISLYYAGSKQIKKLQLDLQREAIELAKDKKEAPTQKEIEDRLYAALVAGYRGIKVDGKELKYNESNTKKIIEVQYIRHLIEETTSKMGNFSEI